MKPKDYVLLAIMGLTLSILFLATVLDAGAAEVIIGPHNAVFVDGELTEKAALKASSELMTLSSKVAHKKPLYLIINTKGGTLTAGNLLAIGAEMVPNPVHTVSCFAAGTGFNLVQRLGVRYIAEKGVMVALKPKNGIGGQLDEDFRKKYEKIVAQIKEINERNAARMRIDVDKYDQLIQNELWLTGKDAVLQGAADIVIEQSVCEMESGK